MFLFLERLEVVGLMPERALLRLKRENIPLYRIQKIDGKRIRLCVKRKDVKRVFSAYPQGDATPYKIKSLGGVGGAKWIDFCKKRVGFCLGVILFCGTTACADDLVLGVDFVGSSVYAREALQILEEHGVKKYAFYKKGKEDEIAAKLTALKGVEFCSVKKVGTRVRVEIRLDPFSTETLYKDSMQAKHAGELLSLTVLRGEPLKKAGDIVSAGETLVGNWLYTKEGEQIRVEPIARARIACVYEAEYEGIDEETAFAQTYLALDLSKNDEILEKSFTWTETGILVKIRYLVIETVNF